MASQVTFTGSNGQVGSVQQPTLISTNPTQIALYTVPPSFYGSVILSTQPSLAVPGQVLQVLAQSTNINAVIRRVTVTGGAAFNVTIPTNATVGVNPVIVASVMIPNSISASALSVNALNANNIVYLQIPLTVNILRITLSSQLPYAVAAQVLNIFAVSNISVTPSFARITAPAIPIQSVFPIQTVQLTVSEIFSTFLSSNFSTASSISIQLFDSGSRPMTSQPLVLPILTFTLYTEPQTLEIGDQFGIFGNAVGTFPSVDRIFILGSNGHTSNVPVQPAVVVGTNTFITNATLDIRFAGSGIIAIYAYSGTQLLADPYFIYFTILVI